MTVWELMEVLDDDTDIYVYVGDSETPEPWGKPIPDGEIRLIRPAYDIDWNSKSEVENSVYVYLEVYIKEHKESKK